MSLNEQSCNPVTIDFNRVEGRKLVKTYGTTRALCGIDVDFLAGTITAIQGPNGSGKSTLLHLLALMSHATSGEIRFGRYHPKQYPQLRKRIGYLAHEFMLYPDLSGVENLHFVASLYSLDLPDIRIKSLCDRFGLTRFVDRPTRTYSRGQLQRLAIARALIHRPRLLLLDEPSTGLDSRSVERLVAALKDERQRGTISVLVTHDAGLSKLLADHEYHLKRGMLLRKT